MSTTAYAGLKADDRQELRLPRLLKQHLAEVARRRGQSVSEYIVQVLAADVGAEMTKAFEWQLTAPEFGELLKVLATPAADTLAMAAAKVRVAELFGTSTGE